MIIGIASFDGKLAPCFLKEEQYFESDSCKVYPGTNLDALEKRLLLYRETLDSKSDRGVYGVFSRDILVRPGETITSFEWDPLTLGPRVIPGFI